MSNFANVYVGAAPDDGTGTPLRNAFQLINTNFANIASGNANITISSPVATVAGRTGNIVLTVNDVYGAASVAYIDAVATAANTYVDGVAASIGSTNVAVLNTRISTIDANLGVATNNITTLFSNAATQTTALVDLGFDVSTLRTSLDSAVATLANTSAVAYTAAANISLIYLALGNNSVRFGNIESNIALNDGAITNLVISTESLHANTHSQQSAITELQSRADAADSSIGSITANWQSNAAVQSLAIGNLSVITTTLSNQITGANAAIVAANTAVVSYVDTLNSAMSANVANVANDHNNLNGALNNITLLFANAAIQAAEIVSINSNVAAANAAIITANTSMKGYVDYNVQQVDDQVHTVSTALVSIINNQAAANAAIITANTSMKSYVDTQISGNIQYTMGNYRNWTSGNVTTISSALDQLAARLKAAGF